MNLSDHSRFIFTHSLTPTQSAVWLHLAWLLIHSFIYSLIHQITIYIYTKHHHYHSSDYVKSIHRFISLNTPDQIRARLQRLWAAAQTNPQRCKVMRTEWQRADVERGSGPDGSLISCKTLTERSLDHRLPNFPSDPENKQLLLKKQKKKKKSSQKKPDLLKHQRSGLMNQSESFSSNTDTLRSQWDPSRVIITITIIIMTVLLIV